MGFMGFSQKRLFKVAIYPTFLYFCSKFDFFKKNLKLLFLLSFLCYY